MSRIYKNKTYIYYIHNKYHIYIHIYIYDIHMYIYIYKNKYCMYVNIYIYIYHGKFKKAYIYIYIIYIYISFFHLLALRFPMSLVTTCVCKSINSGREDLLNDIVKMHHRTNQSNSFRDPSHFQTKKMGGTGPGPKSSSRCKSTFKG